MDLDQRRSQDVRKTVEAIKRIVATRGETRAAVGDILQKVKELAAHAEYWQDFAAPEGDELQARYLISEEPDHSYALYLNVIRPGKKKLIPHNHTTWACIAGVSGVEENRIYRRLDDGGSIGRAQLEQTDTVMVGPGGGIALLGDDIHAVRCEEPIRHLHMYGMALETLDRRVAYDLDAGTVSVRGVGAPTRR